MKIFVRIIGAAFAIALSTSAASAEGYIGGSLGQSATEPAVAEEFVNSWNADNWGPGNDCDTLGCFSDQNVSGAVKFFAGYRLNRYFAVEGFVDYLGSFDSVADDGFGVTATATVDIRTAGIAAVGMIPVSDSVSLLAKLGGHSWSAEGDFVVSDAVLLDGDSGTFDDSGTNGMGGVGVQIDFGNHAAMRVEFEYFLIETSNTDFGVGFLSVGGMFRF